MIRLSGSTGSIVVLGSFARGANKFVCPDRNFHDSAVMNSSLGSRSSTAVGDRDRIAVRATRGFAILVRPCSTIRCNGDGVDTDWSADIPCYIPLSIDLFLDSFCGIGYGFSMDDSPFELFSTLSRICLSRSLGYSNLES